MSFQTNLESLNKVARKDLRELSWTYAVLANEMRNANLADDNVAADPPVVPDGGAFAKAWASLRGDIVTMLDTCAGNAVKVGKAMEHVVDTYSATDARIADTMRGLTESLNHTPSA
ncbi:hypothetical protein ALI144C_19185 [Actinosynnema sp. ALI-1.44]|uniref:hypothetical protein n=1 Tax=Actinosynnema sp. ALI-1.44 TaxID=1933779 RepID=UPI00097CA641|nr:hypothetical protein [Actinosynnema sp. ALI-1.44]ONI81458.1 hypothetical protein ALI144C_19185 [Actinosynnema sp. ALI-1.44]